MLKILFVALAFLSGAVALSHELLWTRRLIDLLGATEAVTGRVLGLFFLGLSLGGWLATRWGRSAGNSGIRLGIAEASIALLSLPAIFLPYWADGLVGAIGIDLLVAWQGTVIKLLISAAVVMPPAIAMGTTMPMFIRVITDLGGTVRGSGIWIYAINMIGGVFGLWFVSTFLLERSGVRGAMFCAAAGNVVIAVVSFACAGKFSLPTEESVVDADQSKVELSALDKASRRTVFVLSFASGAIVLASEVLVLRLLNLIAPSSLQTTSALLANVILFLALGSIAVAILNRFKVSSQVQLMIGAIGAALFCALCPLVLYQVTHRLVSLRYLVALSGGTIDSLASYWTLLFTVIAVSSGAAMFFYGLVFPSVMSMHSSLDPKGHTVGLLLAINGVGGLLGAEAANLFLVAQIGIYPGFVIVSIATLVLVLVICMMDGRWYWLIAVVMVAVYVAGSCYQPYQELTYLSPNTKKKFDIKETRFGRDGVLMVVETETKARSLLMNNQYQLGSASDIATATERRQLLLPWLLNQDAKDVCCIGLATGISASGLEKVKSPPRVTAVELSSSVADIAEEFFAKENGPFFRRPGNKVVIEDGRTFIACADNDFDLIVADLFRPFGAGESRLFSLEHFQNAKRALRPGGLFCQWLPGHQLNQEHFETIAATFQKVFPNTLVVSAGHDSRVPPMIGLCGWQDDRQWEAQDLSDRIQAYRKFNGGLDKVVDNPQWLVIGVLKKTAFEQVRLNTLDNAILEIDAGRFWITKDLRPNQPASNLKNGFISRIKEELFLKKIIKLWGTINPPKNQPASDNLENGFISRKNWKPFLKKIFENTDPVLDEIHRKEQFEGRAVVPARS